MTKQSEIEVVVLTEEEFKKAEDMAKRLTQSHEGQTNRNILCEDFDLKGRIGEWAFYKWALKNMKGLSVMPEIEQCMDIKVTGKADTADFTLFGKILDIKTMGTSQPPKPHYRVNVSTRQKDKTLDYFVFVHTNIEKRICWIVGFMEKERFLKNADFHEANKPYQPWFTPQVDLYDASIKSLRPIQELFMRCYCGKV